MANKMTWQAHAAKAVFSIASCLYMGIFLHSKIMSPLSWLEFKSLNLYEICDAWVCVMIHRSEITPTLHRFRHKMCQWSLQLRKLSWPVLPQGWWHQYAHPEQKCVSKNEFRKQFYQPCLVPWCLCNVIQIFVTDNTICWKQLSFFFCLHNLLLLLAFL